MNTIKKHYDSSWDLIQSEKGNLPQSEEAWEKKSKEWASRNWLKWLNSNLSFPFEAKRFDDDDDAYFTDIAKHAPFRLGHVMQVLSIDSENSVHGIFVKVQEGEQVNTVPLCDLEVKSRKDKNYWVVREYVVWDANR